MLKHDEEPERGELSEEDLTRVKQISSSPYFIHIGELKPKVVGKEVMASSSGQSGFLLHLDNGSWVISFLKETRLYWRAGEGTPTPNDLALMNVPRSGNGNNPLMVDLPYADEGCDMAAEIACCHGQPIIGLAIGQDSFNFCFPGGRELESMIVPDSEGRPALRVFWEQW